MEFLWESLLSITWQQLVMYVVGGLLIWLAIEKGFEPALLLPMGFGAILVNLPTSGVINQVTAGVGETHGIIQWLFEVGISASEAMPILLFIGIGAMIDFGPLLANLITLLLGITISFSMKADQFVKPETLLIMVLGLVAFVLDSVVGVLFVKVLNLFTPKNKINPMVGAAGISAFPMSSRVIEKLGQEADPQNHLLMHAVAANVSGQIASVVAGGVILQYCATHMIG